MVIFYVMSPFAKNSCIVNHNYDTIKNPSKLIELHHKSLKQEVLKTHVTEMFYCETHFTGTTKY